MLPCAVLRRQNAREQTLLIATFEVMLLPIQPAAN